MARIVGRTRTKIRIELRVAEEEWARFRSEYGSEAHALRAVRTLFEDSLRVALLWEPGVGSDTLGDRHRS
jgi:hypothetical protein